MKLFKVEQNKTPTKFFADKKAAKAFRDKVNEAGGSVIVKRGPDHRRGET